MIKANFLRSEGFYTAFSIEGHAGYADFGKDIVCAGVTSAVMTVLNGITEVAKINASVDVLENEIVLNLAERSKTGEVLLSSLRLQLEVLSEDYPDTINITVTEV